MQELHDRLPLLYHLYYTRRSGPLKMIDTVACLKSIPIAEEKKFVHSGIRFRLFRFLALGVLVAIALAGCVKSSSEKPPTPKRTVLSIGAIPDEDASVLTRRFNLFSEYLSEQIGVEVRYVPANDYAALVTAFRRGDIQLAWFGGLTGVQARAVTPGAQAIAQRPQDASFFAHYIVQSDLPVEKLADLKGLSFTFGSESSTSGHLMPRFYLTEAGVQPDKDFAGQPNYSGSHDRTLKLVESGAFQAGALNEAVWDSRVAAGEVDTDKVRLFHTAGPYYNYNWTVHPTIDERFGQGMQAKITAALLGMGPEQKEILEMFYTDSFIETNNENYEGLRVVAEDLGILK
jgi:phosphonate transport system substrate-binding protein